MEIDIPIVNDKKRIRPVNSEVDRLVCNNKKLLSSTTWGPRYNLRSGLSETINWFKDHGQNKKAELYQI